MLLLCTTFLLQRDKYYSEGVVHTSKVVLITGAKHGIGFGIATAFSKRKYDVVVSDVDGNGVKKSALELKRKYGNRVLPVKCDVSKKTDVVAMINAVKKKFGSVDILINNAGIYPFKPFNELTEKDWDKVLDVNLKGVYLVTKEVVKMMTGGGKIVNISSIAGLIGYQALTHYCASKAGIMGFTRALALELAPLKINVNAIAPGAIETPGTEQALKDEALKQVLATIPWKRVGSPKDIASAVLFLSSNNADYITGQTIVVDGGYTLQ